MSRLPWPGGVTGRDAVVRILALAASTALAVLGVAAGAIAPGHAGPPRLDPATLARGADPAVAYLVEDVVRDGALRVAVPARGKHDALWAVQGGYLLRDHNVGPHRRVRVVFVARTGERRLVARSPHWRHPATAWWDYRRDRVRRFHDQAAVRADLRHDRVVLTTSRIGEFCLRVAVLSSPRRTLWRSCGRAPHAWSRDGRHVLMTHTYFDAAGTDTWWVGDGRTGRPLAAVGGRLDWHAVWEDDAHFLTLAQSDDGTAAIVRCDLSGACERASRLWDVPLPEEPSLYYASPPVVLAADAPRGAREATGAGPRRGAGVQRAVIEGTSDDDDLVGTSGADRVRAGAGDDTVHARGGADHVRGGPDDDLVDLGGNPLLMGPSGDVGFGGTGDDVLLGGPGFDVLVGNRGRDTLAGGTGTNTMEDRRGADVVLGGPDSDVVHLGPGADRVDLLGADDAVFVRPDGSADVVVCGPGRDTVYRGRAVDPLDRFVGCEAFRSRP